MKYKIGEVKPFSCKDGFEFGTIIGYHKENTGIFYDFHVIRPDNDYYHFDVPEKDIIIVPPVELPSMHPWAEKHLEEINTVFGKNMAKKVMLIYDSPEMVEDGLNEYLNLEHPRYFKKVLNKYVGVIN